jgi:hypothetical protein
MVKTRKDFATDEAYVAYLEQELRGRQEDKVEAKKFALEYNLKAILE